MTDTGPSPEPARPQPQKLGGRAKAGIVVGAVLCLAAGAGGGFYAGRATTDTGSQTESCSEVRATVRDMGQQAKAAPAKADSITRIQLNMMIQNPSCFPAEARAAAQDALNQQEQGATRAALCAAADASWWECH